MKQILVTFSDGSVYSVPALDIALNRAAYYANRDLEKDPNISWQSVYDNETEYAMQNDEELLDWFRNNMDWDDEWEQVNGPQPIDQWNEHAFGRAMYEVYC